jgi:hypothetical protein
MEGEKKIASHSYIFLEGDSFRCSCGSETGAVHTLVYTDGSVKEECNNCFLFDKDVEAAGILDNPESFVPQDEKKSKKKKEESDPQPFGNISNYYTF